MKCKELNNLSNKQLILKAYQEEDDDVYMKYIDILRTRGNTEVFKLTKKLAYSKDSVNREIAASILAQFAYKTKQHQGESIYLLGKLLYDNNEDVVVNAIYGFGHRKCTRYANRLASCISYQSLQIKEALSFTLGWYEDTKSIDVLIELMNDDNNDVRDWATFSLAKINSVDTQVIRDALYKNLDDKVLDIRGEALLGLALRKDKRVISSIIEDLQKPFYGSWLIAAICEMPDCRYLPYFEDFIDSLDKKDKIALDDNIREAKEALMLVSRG